MKPFLFCLVLATVAFSSCKKKDPFVKEDPVTLMTKKSWKPSSIDRNASINPQGNFTYYAIPDCETDDTYQFTEDSKLSLDRGQKKCQPAEVSPELTSYILDLPNGKITVRNVTYILLEIAPNQLKYYLPTAPGSEYSAIVYMFQH